MLATLDEIKLLSGLSSDYDARITALIPIVQNFIVDYTNNRFEVDEGISCANVVFDSLLKTITATEDINFEDYGIYANKDISIQNSNYNDGIYSVASVINNIITINEELNNESSSNIVDIRLVSFPQSLKFVASQIIKNWLLNKSVSGISSEQLGDYSISYSGDLTPNIIKLLNSYRLVKFI